MRERKKRDGGEREKVGKSKVSPKESLILGNG